MATDNKKAKAAKGSIILAYEAAGYTLMPLNGKVPVISDWGSIPIGKYGVKELIGRNFGVVLQSEDLVIDVDPRNFPKEENSLRKLTERIGSFPITFTVRTGRGGLHIYLKKPADLSVVGERKEDFRGIEYKTKGQQVVGALSFNSTTGNTYEVVRGDLTAIAAAPTPLLDLIERKHQRTETKAGLKEGEFLDDAGTQGRFISYLRETAPAAVEGQGGDTTTFRVGCFGRDLGLSPAVAYDLMMEFWNPRCKPPWSSDRLLVKVKNAYKYARNPVGTLNAANDFEDLGEGKKTDKTAGSTKEEVRFDIDAKTGKVRKNFRNLLSYLRLPTSRAHNVFGFNEFTGAVEVINPAPWHNNRMPDNRMISDVDLKMLKGYLVLEHNFEQSIAAIEEAVTIVAQDHRFHPVREYLSSLEWDGVERLDSWLIDFLGARDSDYVRAVGRKVLCAAVMRIYHPGIKFDHVLVLEGAQRIGKSTVPQILAGEWAGDFPIDPHSKDTVQLMQGRWVVELAEMEVTRRTETEALKAFLTRRTDMVRLPYARLPLNFPRQSIFIATKNPNAEGEYLTDTTGNRRWWPVDCRPRGGVVDFEKLKRVRNQLWAEAVARVAKKGEYLFMETDKLREGAQAEVALREQRHPWTERIAEWLDTLNEDENFVTTRRVWTDCFLRPDCDLDRRKTVAIASVLHCLGWRRHVKRVGGRLVRGFALGFGNDERREEKEDPLKGLVREDDLEGLV